MPQNKAEPPPKIWYNIDVRKGQKEVKKMKIELNPSEIVRIMSAIRLKILNIDKVTRQLEQKNQIKFKDEIDDLETEKQKLIELLDKVKTW